jgi:hypothetical protein
MKSTSKKKTTKKELIRLPASRAHIWANCGASVKLKDAGNPFSPFDAARKGILTHKIAASKLLYTYTGDGYGDNTDRYLNAWEKQLFADNKEEIEEAISFYFRLVVEEFRAFREKYKDGSLHIEEELKIFSGPYIFQGPPDVYFLSRKAEVVHVFDLKSGWVEVEAKGNEQLILYGHSIAYLNKLKNPILKGTIAQPLLSQVANATYHFDPNFFSSISVDTSRFSVGAHCTKCPALTACVKAKEKIEFFNNPRFADDTLSREKYFPELLAIAPVGEEFFKRIQKEAKAILELGGKIEGWTLGKGKAGKRVWGNAVDKKQLAEITGVEAGMLVEEKLLSPKGVEDLLKGKKEIKLSLKALHYQPVYPTLVRTSSEEAFMNVKQIKEEKVAKKNAKAIKNKKYKKGKKK